MFGLLSLMVLPSTIHNDRRTPTSLSEYELFENRRRFPLKAPRSNQQYRSVARQLNVQTWSRSIAVNRNSTAQREHLSSRLQFTPLAFQPDVKNTAFLKIATTGGSQPCSASWLSSFAPATSAAHPVHKLSSPKWPLAQDTTITFLYIYLNSLLPLTSSSTMQYFTLTLLATALASSATAQFACPLGQRPKGVGNCAPNTNWPVPTKSFCHKLCRNSGFKYSTGQKIGKVGPYNKPLTVCFRSHFSDVDFL